MEESSVAERQQLAKQLLQQLVFVGRRMDAAAIARAFYNWKADVQAQRRDQNRQLQQQQLLQMKRDADASSARLLAENRRLSTQVQQLQGQCALSPSEAGPFRGLAEFASELLAANHTTSQQHQLSACKEMLLTIQLKNAKLVQSADSFLNMISLMLDPFVEGDLSSIGQPAQKPTTSTSDESKDTAESELSSKRIILCMHVLREQLEELMAAAEASVLGTQTVQEQPGAQPRTRQAVSQSPPPPTRSDESLKPFTWHSPKVVLEPKREICFPLPVPEEWSVGPRQRVKLEWDIRIRQGVSMAGYTDVSLQMIDEDAEYYSDESSDDESEYTSRLHSRVQEEDEVVDKCRPAHLRGFRFLRPSKNYRIRIRNTAFMAPIELSYKIVLMPNPDDALTRDEHELALTIEHPRPEDESDDVEQATQRHLSENEEQSADFEQETPDSNQLAAVSIAYRRIEQAHYQAELLTRSYLSLWTKWRRNRGTFRGALVMLAQANKRLVTIQTYQTQLHGMERLNALTCTMEAENSTPVQFEVQPESISTLSEGIVYSAEGLKVGAGEDFRIRDANIVDGTKVTWSFSVSPAGGDIGFCVCVRHADGSLPPVVDYRRYVGSSDSPVTGEYVVEEAASPDIEIIFDNSYSWINPKTLSYHINIQPPTLADTVTIETPQEVHPAEVVATAHSPTPENSPQESNEVTQEQLQMEQVLAQEAILALTETVSMCTNEAEQIAQQIRSLLDSVMEFWSIHGEIYYNYDATTPT